MSSPIHSRVPVEVRYAETDQMGVVHHSVYVIWFEVARTALCRETGHPYVDIEKMVDNGFDATTDCDDNCLALPNPGQQDADGDAIGDHCDATPTRPFSTLAPAFTRAIDLVPGPGGTFGTDHGWGSCMLAFGGAVQRAKARSLVFAPDTPLTLEIMTSVRSRLQLSRAGAWLV